MEFVLYHDRDYVSVRGEGAPYTLMDRASAEMIVDAAFVIFQDGTTERELWENANKEIDFSIVDPPKNTILSRIALISCSFILLFFFCSFLSPFQIYLPRSGIIELSKEKQKTRISTFCMHISCA